MTQEKIEQEGGLINSTEQRLFAAVQMERDFFKQGITQFIQDKIDLQRELEALEKKLAEQQAVFVRMGYVGRFDGTEELTKREAAAFARGDGDGYVMGFFAGKQAGRDEVLTELSNQDPVKVVAYDEQKIFGSVSLATGYIKRA